MTLNKCIISRQKAMAFFSRHTWVTNWAFTVVTLQANHVQECKKSFVQGGWQCNSKCIKRSWKEGGYVVLLTYGGLVNAWLKRGQREVKQWSNTGFVHRLDTLYPKPWIALSLACHWHCFARCLANSEYISLVWPLIIHCSCHCLTATYSLFYLN